ncbi:MAG: LysM peptidoglycan-binding domain-containing protein, partial [Thermodesulfobacteriota bacterium]
MRRRIFLWMGLSILFTSLAICGDLLAKETYRVQHGDTLTGIAGKIGVTPGALKAANQMKGSSLKANQTLIIPSPKIKNVSKSIPSPLRQGEVYVVKKRDTLAGIARKTGVSIAELREINRLPGSALKIGQKLSL